MKKRVNKNEATRVPEGCATCKSFPKSIFYCGGKNTGRPISDFSINLHFKRGQDLYNEDGPAKGVFCIMSGKVKAIKRCQDGSNVAVGLSAPGDIMGYQNMSSETVYSQTAECLEDTRACFIPMKNFSDTLSENPDIVAELLRRSITEGNYMAYKIKSLRCRNVRERVAMAIFEIERKFKEYHMDPAGIPITRKSVAEIAGTTIESAIRYLNEFRKEKLISISEKKVKILNREKLHAVSTNRH